MKCISIYVELNLRNIAMPTLADTAAIWCAAANLPQWAMSTWQLDTRIKTWVLDSVHTSFFRVSCVCRPVPLYLDAFFGMVSKLIRQADESMQPNSIYGLCTGTICGFKMFQTYVPQCINGTILGKHLMTSFRIFLS